VEKIDEILQMITANHYITAVVIIFISLIAAVIVDFFITRVFRVLARRTETTIDDAFIELIHKPIRISVVLLGLWMAAHRLELPSSPEEITASILKTIAVLVWTVFAVRFFALLLKHFSHSDRYRVIEPRTQILFDNLSKVIFAAAAIYLILILWNIDVSAWLASAGIIGIAVGFAAKDTLANLFSGIFILTDSPYEIGDYINLDTGERGQVTHIGLRSTRLLTRDDVEVTIPNALMANAKVVNETGGPWEKERIRIKVNVAYGSDVDRLKEILREIAEKHSQTCDDPTPKVRFRTFGDSALNFELLCWISEPVLRGRVIDALNTEIYKRLAQEGIRIPYPKRDIYIKEMPGAKMV
jgi:small-conductance mechanosensitive channel